MIDLKPTKIISDKIKNEVEEIILSLKTTETLSIFLKETYLNMLYQDNYVDDFIERFSKIKKMGFPYKE